MKILATTTEGGRIVQFDADEILALEGFLNKEGIAKLQEAVGGMRTITTALDEAVRLLKGWPNG